MIVDASVVVSALTDKGPEADWAAAVLASGVLVAPHLMPAEVCQIFRRLVLTRALSRSEATAALRDLSDLRTELQPLEPFLHRVWEMRDTVSAYDAWYVALAEALDVPLATLDLRLASAPGTRCTFVVPDDGGGDALMPSGEGFE